MAVEPRRICGAVLVAALVGCGSSGGQLDAGSIDAAAAIDASTVDATAIDGGGFGPYPTPAIEGLIITVDDSFWANTDDFVTILAESDVELYWTLISANFYGKKPYRALGHEIIRHPQSYFENAVIPLLERYAGSGVIWAIDCMNEPEAMIAGSDGNYQSYGVSWDEMRSFLRYCADTVHAYAPGIAVSAGSGWHDWDNVAAGRFSGLHFDFLDYHYYADAPAAPAVASLGVELPVIIGECGQSSDSWDDELQHDALAGCFGSAKSGGYAAALGWYLDYAGSTNKHAHLNSDGSWRPAGALYQSYSTDPALAVGLNQAWLFGGYDHDFGANPLHPDWGIAYDSAGARELVDRYAAAGIPIMRLWAFEGQEALPFHVVFDDFEQGAAGWLASAAAVSTSIGSLWVSDGDAGLVVDYEVTAPGWFGVVKRWSADTPLNLAHASSLAFFAHNDLGRAVGVNVAFVVGEGAGSKVYQTRSGALGGQLWLEDGASGSASVTLAAADFAEQWALRETPDTGASRPPPAELEEVRELRVRVYFSAPVSGTLHLDAVRIR